MNKRAQVASCRFLISVCQMILMHWRNKLYFTKALISLGSFLWHMLSAAWCFAMGISHISYAAFHIPAYTIKIWFKPREYDGAASSLGRFYCRAFDGLAYCSFMPLRYIAMCIIFSERAATFIIFCASFSCLAIASACDITLFSALIITICWWHIDLHFSILQNLFIVATPPAL